MGAWGEAATRCGSAWLGGAFVGVSAWRIIEMEMYVFFFFQAEDGIRDLTVTGVQTCALPIWLLTPPVLAHIEAQYQRHGTYGIFVSRLLPVWRAVVPPFAGIAGLSAPRALIPLALASALWYGLLTVLVASLGTNLDAVVAALAHVNWVLG